LGSWIVRDAGGGAHFGQGLMGRRRLDFEKFDLQNSIDLAGKALKETIHERGEAVGRGWKEQHLFREGRNKTRASSSEIGVLSKVRNLAKEEQKTRRNSKGKEEEEGKFPSSSSTDYWTFRSRRENNAFF
jgi:hypothetical protein